MSSSRHMQKSHNEHSLYSIDNAVGSAGIVYDDEAVGAGLRRQEQLGVRRPGSDKHTILVPVEPLHKRSSVRDQGDLLVRSWRVAARAVRRGDARGDNPE